MKLNHNLHLGYSSNIHRGQTWAETLDSLGKYTLAVRQEVCPNDQFGIGLRLSAAAAKELAEKKTLRAFQHWLEENSCYVFTINGFPFGQFHAARVKEKVYLPDWTSPERLEYTNLLFDLLAELLPAGVEGSVSTLPGSFKDFIQTDLQEQAIRQNLWHCIEHISRVSEKSGRRLHLGLEPEPLCLLENSAETISFFEQMRDERKSDPRLNELLGVNYDCCHFAIEYEEPRQAMAAFQNAGVKISKIHLSSAIKTIATDEARNILAKFSDDIYLHQVIARGDDGTLKFYHDLPEALGGHAKPNSKSPEWRVHFHVPLHAAAAPPLENTNDHLLGILDLLGKNPQLCPHLEMETYTWEVLPPELKSQNVVDQLAAEYRWTLARLAERRLS
jgi:hypothetical protein